MYYRFRANYIKLRVNRSLQNIDDLGEIQIDEKGQIIHDIPNIDFDNLTSKGSSSTSSCSYIGLSQVECLKAACEIIKSEIEPEVLCFIENEVYITSKTIHEHLHNVCIQLFVSVAEEILLRFENSNRATITSRDNEEMHKLNQELKQPERNLNTVLYSISRLDEANHRRAQRSPKLHSTDLREKQHRHLQF